MARSPIGAPSGSGTAQRAGSTRKCLGADLLRRRVRPCMVREAGECTSLMAALLTAFLSISTSLPQVPIALATHSRAYYAFATPPSSASAFTTIRRLIRPACTLSFKPQDKLPLLPLASRVQAATSIVSLTRTITQIKKDDVYISLYVAAVFDLANTRPCEYYSQQTPTPAVGTVMGSANGDGPVPLPRGSSTPPASAPSHPALAGKYYDRIAVRGSRVAASASIRSSAVLVWNGPQGKTSSPRALETYLNGVWRRYVC
ncbi:hypothetical protein K438DRAFT_2026119 [Mycena galopus ATCC 62051]|nr:hypothetical protein K438DRAFT_2026119 [Mycena galopus ATCC 62051]